MSTDVLLRFLLWCAVINYTALIYWVVLSLFAAGWLHRIGRDWFHVSDEMFDAINYAGILFYKLAIVVLNLAPYIALRIAAG